MDENKEFLSSEPEDENTIKSDADTVTDEQTTGENTDVFGVFSDELSDIESQQVQPVDYNSGAVITAKKKRFIQVPIIISAVLVAAVALGFLIFKCFFDTSIVGTWVVDNSSTADEAADSTENDNAVLSYYIFDDNGDVSIAIGSMKMVGTYTLTSGEQGTSTVEINIPTFLQGAFEYEVSGNMFTGRNLKLTDSYYGASYNFKSTTYKAPELKVDENFKPSDKLTGSWVYNEGYKYVYTFNSDGTATINQNDLLYADGVYTYTDDTITITYSNGTESTMKLSYSIENDKLIIDGYAYTKYTDASADEL